MAQRNIVPGAQHINQENAVQPQTADQADQNVLAVLENLIRSFGDLEKTILYRTFESLENHDNEKSPDLSKCAQLFQQNLHFFRKEFPTQRPLFRNIGFVAQRIGRVDTFKEMFNHPKLPNFLLYNKETHTRVYLLIKHYMRGDTITLIPQPEEIEKKGMLYIGYFFTFVTNKNNESSLEFQDGYVQQNGTKLEPISFMNGEKRCTIYVLSDVENKNPFTFSIAVNENYPHPKTLFSWFCIQHVSFHPSCIINIKHPNKDCQIMSSSFCNPRYLCPACGQGYSMRDVSIAGGPFPQMQQTAIPQQPYQAYNNQVRQASSYYPQNYKPPMQQMHNQAPQLSQNQLQHISPHPPPPQLQTMPPQQQQPKPVAPALRPMPGQQMPIPQHQQPPIPQPMTQQRPPIPPQIQQQYQYMAQATNQQIPQHPIPQQIMQQQSMISPQQNLRSPYQYNMHNYMSPPMRSPVMSSSISPTTPQQIQPSPGFYQPIQQPVPMQAKPVPTNALESWPNILNQTTTDKNKLYELPSLFQEEEYEEYYNEIGCGEIDDGMDIDIDSYKNIYDI